MDALVTPLLRDLRCPSMPQATLNHCLDEIGVVEVSRHPIQAAEAGELHVLSFRGVRLPLESLLPGPSKAIYLRTLLIEG